MQTRGVEVSRKKACQNCANSKVRCNLEKPVCSRCRARAQQCLYPGERSGVRQDSTSISLSAGNLVAEASTPSSWLHDLHSMQVPAEVPNAVPGNVHDFRQFPSDSEFLPVASGQSRFDKADLVPMADPEDVRDHWMTSYLGTGTRKHFSPYTVQFVTCILRTYPNHLLDERSLPPFIHQQQLEGASERQVITDCFTLVRMWTNRRAGSETIVASTVREEMKRISRMVSRQCTEF